MFVIAHVLPTDYEPSNDRDQLQDIADELNQDAIASDVADRWIVVHQAIHQGLLEGDSSLSLSETQSCWQLISNRAMLLPYARGL